MSSTVALQMTTVEVMQEYNTGGQTTLAVAFCNFTFLQLDKLSVTLTEQYLKIKHYSKYFISKYLIPS